MQRKITKIILISLLTLTSSLTLAMERAIIKQPLLDNPTLFDRLPTELISCLTDLLSANNPEIATRILTVHGDANQSQGDKIVTVSTDDRDSTVTIWNATDGTFIATLAGRRDYFIATLAGRRDSIWALLSVEFSPQGDKIVTASGESCNRTVKIWKVADGSCIATILSSFSASAQFNRQGDKILTFCGDEAKIWNASDGRCLVTLRGHTARIYSAQFNHEDDKVVTASQDNTAKIWKVSDGTCIATLTEHTNTVFSAQFSPQGHTIVTASNDNTGKIWNVADGVCIAS